MYLAFHKHAFHTNRLMLLLLLLLFLHLFQERVFGPRNVAGGRLFAVGFGHLFMTSTLSSTVSSLCLDPPHPMMVWLCCVVRCVAGFTLDATTWSVFSSPEHSLKTRTVSNINHFRVCLSGKGNGGRGNLPSKLPPKRTLCKYRYLPLSK